ncbi:hypothetical protein [Glutamicibacter halophytocola]|uniref:Uncharacterized protein n=1 Tax=Glutamicibacter halophytocola TaxID=1933880 RepID=A0AA94XTI5_9MICC|nr:hypothetical protein [Glutamicibacter halophytocola]UUX60186.1 hypothetical protein NUH22_06120 [Glutamicibacter halophytocola]
MMPGWIEQLAQPGILWPTAIIMFILWLILRACFKFFPFLSKFVSLVNTLVGTDEKPGLKKWQEEQTKKLDGQGEILERVRHQVENDHTTNMREEQDKMIATQDKLMHSVEQLTSDFKEHVAISKAKDKEGDETAYRVAALADKVNEIQPIVKQLGQTWGTKTKNN